MIVFDNVSFRFNETEVFDNFKASIGDGITVIVGKSGYGKTTLLRLISGLIKPTSGRVISDYNKPAVIFQEQRLLNWYSALKNVTVVNEHGDKSYAERLLLKLGISREDFSKMPSQLSGGMRQRVCLARALFYGGDILLLDEPFNGLDGENREKAVALIKAASKTMPVIIVSHIEEDARLADMVIDLEKR